MGLVRFYFLVMILFSSPQLLLPFETDSAYQRQLPFLEGTLCTHHWIPAIQKVHPYGTQHGRLPASARPHAFLTLCQAPFLCAARRLFLCVCTSATMFRRFPFLLHFCALVPPTSSAPEETSALQHYPLLTAKVESQLFHETFRPCSNSHRPFMSELPRFQA